MNVSLRNDELFHLKRLVKEDRDRTYKNFKKGFVHVGYEVETKTFEKLERAYLKDCERWKQ